jgi:CheY-like chemotaxis protein/HD-like signal output (HDOD) protein
MTRILFVDDETRILDGLRRLLWQRRGVWDMEFAAGPAAALAALRNGVFDILVTDMRMPEMDGASLLEIAMREWPCTARLVLSGQTEHSAAERVARVAHQFISKPCDPKELIGAIERLESNLRLVPDEATRRVLGQVVTVPSPLRIYDELAGVLAEPAPLPRLAALVRRDPGLAATVLHLVDTTFFGRGHAGPRIEAALGALGTGPIRSVVLGGRAVNAAAVRAIGDVVSLEDEARHAQLTAVIARAIAPPDVDRFVASKAGLLHDVGRLVSAAWLKDLPALTHDVVGGYLLGLWGLRPELVAAVSHHHHPDRADASHTSLVATVHVADLLAGEIAPIEHRVPDEGEFDAAAVQQIGGWQLFPKWREAARAAAAEVAIAA